MAIADDDGAVWRLYKPTRANPSILRLASLSDEYGNALLTAWDEHGRLVGSRRAAGDRRHPAL